MKRPKPDFPELIEVKLPTPEEQHVRYEQYLSDMVKSDRRMFEEYVAQGFTEEQAITILIARQPYVVRWRNV